MPSKLDIILSHILKVPRVMQYAASALSPQDFDSNSEAAYKLIYAVALDWYKTYHTLIPEEYMRNELITRIQKAPPNMFTDNDLMKIGEVLNIVYDSVITIQPEVAQTYLSELLLERQIKPVLTTMATTPVNVNFSKQLDELTNRFSRTQFSAATALDELLTVEGAAISGSTKPTPTGLAFVDILMGGGIAPAQTYGILGPTGGGKTTLAIQLACSLIENGIKVAYLSYEGDPRTEIIPRVYSCLGNITRDDLKEYAGRLKDMPGDKSKLLLEKLDKYGSNLKVIDVAYSTGAHKSGCGGPDEVNTIIQQEQDRMGAHIDVVIIDQIWSMVDYYLNAHGIDLQQIRHYINNFIERLRALSQEKYLNNSIFVVHQVANVVKQRSPLALPKKGDAAECRNFENNMHFCGELGVMDIKTGCCWFANPKARNTREDAVIIQMDPNYWRFNYEPDAWRPGERGFIRKSASNDIYNIEANDIDAELKLL